MDNPELRTEADAILAELVGDPGGPARLREDQWQAVAALVEERRRRWSCSAPAGASRRCISWPPLCCARRGSGPTVIISPLLALMRNQVEAAARAGIQARTINSANPEEWETIYGEVERGETDVLLVSPERLKSVDFRDQVLPKLAATTGLLVVDEAHCISDWGHDFRPDYRRLRTMLAELPPGVPVLATTATANARVTADVAEQLGTGARRTPWCCAGRWTGRACGWACCELPDAAHRLAWLGEQLGDLPGSGIIYTLTVAAAEEVTAFLRQRGYPVASYTGKTENADRLQAEEDLLANRVKALVATSALGMGFDKPDLGFVVHLGSPSSPIAYYQQVGRAGRGVDHADVLLLPGREDEAIWRVLRFGGASRPRSRCGARWTVLARGGSAAVAAGAGAAGGSSALASGDDAEGPRRGRGGQAGEGRLDRDRAAVGVRRASATRGWPDSAQAEQQAMRDYVGDDGVPDGVPAAAAGRRAGGPVRPLRQLRRSLVRPGRLSGALAAATRRAGPSGGRGRAPQDVADRACRRSASTSRAVSPRASRQSPGVRWAGCRTSAGATGCARCCRRRPRTGRFRTTCWPPS